jgi:hypothetical protein
MKNSIHPIIKVSAFLLFVTVSFVACKKSDPASTSAAGTAAVVTAQSLSFDGATGIAFNSNAGGIVKVGNLITIGAVQDGTSNSIRIVLSNVTGTGTFSLNKDNTQGNGAIISKDYNKPSDINLNYSTDNGGSGLTGRGSVTITKLTATDAEGTFDISGYNASGKNAAATQGTFKGHVN